MNPFTHVSIAAAHCGRLGMPRRGRGLCAGFTALTLALFVQSAAAADLGDTLRGSFAPQFSTPTYSDWSGVYFGGQLGVSSGHGELRRQPELADGLYSAREPVRGHHPQVA